MNLSKHFTFEEMTASDTAARQGITNLPGSVEAANLVRLCEEILEPLRLEVGRPVTISSGYRCPLLNTIIGGSRMSAHTMGRAADIKVEGMTPLEVCRRIRDMRLPYDQLILEFDAWTHVAIAPDPRLARREELTAVKFAGMTQYNRGIA